MQPTFTHPANPPSQLKRWSPVRFAVTAVFAASLAAACGETDDQPTDWQQGPIGAGATGGTAGAAGTGGGVVQQPGTFGGGGFVAGAVGGAATGGVQQPAGPGPGVQPGAAGGAASGGELGGGVAAETPYCKVKAIVDKNCLGCHGATLAAGAPFRLVTYADLTAAHPTRAGKKVFERVGVRVHADQSQAESLTVMPPGRQLPAADIAIIDQWVAAGAPQGTNPTCAGAAGGGTGGAEPQTKTWPPAECDAVYKVTAHGAGGVNTPAMAPPGVESHPQVAWDAPWGNEEVQAIAFKTITDNPKVLHHWILSGRPGGFLTGWAPGEDGVRLMKPDVGMLMPRGAGAMNLDMHYFNTMGTQAEPDQSGVEICVVKKAKFRKNNAAVTMSLTSLGDFLGGGLAPANTVNHDVTSTCTLGGSQPVTLLSASPHAHKYARHMKFTLTRANGEVIVMHDMPFMFGEQKSYGLDPPVVANPGDTITTTCTYTNMTSRNITFGESTENEMCFNFATYYPAGGLTCSGGGGLIGGFGGGGATGAGGAFGGLLGF
jgi:Copper type II ascorbate-dependent monooxygenase, C-terminal domain